MTTPPPLVLTVAKAGAALAALMAYSIPVDASRLAQRAGITEAEAQETFDYMLRHNLVKKPTDSNLYLVNA